jgi:signal transduction histidine kinase
MLKRYSSISLRLTLLFGSIFFCGYVIFGVVMWLHLRQTLKEERYQTLSRRADRLQELLRRLQTESPVNRTQDFHDFAGATGNGLVEVFSLAGQRIYDSPSKAAAAFPWPSIASSPKERFERARSNSQSYWVLLRPSQLGDQHLYLVLAAPEAGNLTLLNEFWRGLLWSIPLLLIASSAGGYLVSRRALRPVDRITATARSITINNLSGRLPINSSGDELERLSLTFNDMLHRLDSAVGKITQFTADASHELRSPLAFTRTVAEVALRNPAIDPLSRTSFQDIVDENAKASQVLEQLLTLARADAETVGRPLEVIDLAAVVEEVCISARKVAIERGLALNLTTKHPKPTRIQADAPTLRRLLWILLDNAFNYTPSPGQVNVSLATTPSTATLSVADTGVGISPTDLPQIFNRFYRADPSRSQVEGSGLGLAIAKWIADTHHADISVISQCDTGTIFKVTFTLSL